MRAQRTLTICMFWVSACVVAQTGELYSTSPSSTWTIVVPFTAGGSADYAARTFAVALHVLDIPAVTVNVDGASGVLGFRRLARESTAGENLMVLSPIVPLTSAISPEETQELERHIEPICQLYDNLIVIVARKGDAVGRNFGDTVRNAREASISVASGGSRSIPSLALRDAAGELWTRFTHVPYRGEAPALLDLVKGEVDTAVVTYSSVKALVDGGSVELVATLGLDRDPRLAAVPIASEIGFRAKPVSSPGGLFVRTTTSAAMKSRLDRACQTISSQPSFQDALASKGIIAKYRSGSSLRQEIREQRARWQLN